MQQLLPLLTLPRTLLAPLLLVLLMAVLCVAGLVRAYHLFTGRVLVLLDTAGSRGRR